jgi:geranylgeranyl diphosphate synthase, type II
VTGVHAPGRPASERAAADEALHRATRALLADAPGDLAAAIRYAVEGGGKRLRPVLCGAGYRAIARAEPPPGVYDVAAAIELVHTYSLVHDDLPCMDDDALRRGRPTLHRADGWRLATVAGAALIPLAAAQLARGCRRLGLQRGRTAEAARILAVAAGGAGMVGGQQLDLEAEGRAATVEELEAIHARKTGALFTASLRLGGLLADASPEADAGLAAYGAALGLAFQIADDLLDETAAAEVVGKATGKDRARAKATFPALLGTEAARLRAQEAVARGIGALDGAGIRDDRLVALIRFAADRDR